MKKNMKKPLYIIIPAVLIVLLILAVYLEKRGVHLSPIPKDTIGRVLNTFKSFKF